MINLRFIIDKTYKSKIGTYPILLELFENTSHIRIPTGISVPLKEWKGGKDPYDLTKSNEYNRMLGELHTKYMYKLRMLEADGKVANQTISTVRDMLTGGTVKRQSFMESLDAHIARSTTSTASFYKWTRKNILTFTNGKEPNWENITHNWIVRFDKWMADKGNKINTRSIHLRNIATIFHSAIADDIIPADANPFRKMKIMSARKEKTILTAEQIHAIMDLQIPENMPALQLCKDIFLISLFMAGINPVDLWNLKGNDHDDGCIIFQRQKIKFREPEPTHLYVPEIIWDNMNRNMDSTKEYMLDLHQKYANYQNFYDNMKKRIKIIGKAIGVPELTLYHARYTWASIASRIGIDEAVIGRAMSHTPTSLAGQRYISFDWDRVSDAQIKVVGWVMNNKTDK